MKRSSGAIRAVTDGVRCALQHVGPGWFTSVMGTGILALCIAISPVPIPLANPISGGLWSLDLALLVLFAGLWAAAGLRGRATFPASLLDPAKAQLWGAPPMACFTVSAGFLKIGVRLIEPAWCVAAAQALWITGVAGSLFCAFTVPYLMFTRHESTRDKTLGSWLLPVVPPIVASVPAALLTPFWPAAIRGDMLAFAYALLGLGMALAAIVIVIFYSRLVYDHVPAGALVPTMWIVVGPLGQSIAGIIALGGAATNVWPRLATGLQMAGLAYAVLAWGFAMYWAAMAFALTIRAARLQLPFTLGWWAFTFPIGVLTAGTDALYGQTHAHLFAAAGLMLLALLGGAWLLVASRTVHAALRTLRAPAHPRRDHGPSRALRRGGRRQNVAS